MCFSPSQCAMFKKIHRWLGRIGVSTSLIGLGFGYVAAWTSSEVPLGSAIGLSSVGILQLLNTVKGFNAIRKAAKEKTAAKKKALVQEHVKAMNILFYGACLGPSWFRGVPWGAKAASIDPTPLSPWFMFLGMIPAFMTPGLAIGALKRRRFF